MESNAQMTAESGVEAGFTPEQKEYLAGYFAGLGARFGAARPFAAPDAGGPMAPANAALTGAVTAAPAPAEEPTYFGFPVSELCKEEKLKYEENPLDLWEKFSAHAAADRFPQGGDVFRFKFHGLFYVAPNQDAFMLRLRVPAGELNGHQLRGLADLARTYGLGNADVTTRANLQIRGIPARGIVNVLTALADLGLTSRGAGADNVRNITATPTSGFDSDELFDVRPLARGLHHYLLNHRDLFGLPRKFNVGFDSGGSVSMVGDTNDIALVACRPVEGGPLEDGVYFRVLLAGITGHKQFAFDAGLALKPDECVSAAAAMVRVFQENGNRTDRKKARLKYLIDQWGVEKFLAETEKKLSFPLRRAAPETCKPRRPIRRHGHLGVYRQKQPGLNYLGVALPVGRLTHVQMRRLADVASAYGGVRLTVWQNLLLPDVPDADVEKVKRELIGMGLHYEAAAVSGGLVACTGNAGCRFSSTDTKGQALALARHLESRVRLDFPVNIHLTGCPHSCAQHYIGDIGLLGTKVTQQGVSTEAYHVYLGGGGDQDRGLGREVFHGIPFSQIPELLEKILNTYLARRRDGEAFVDFSRRHEVKQLQELFSH